MPADQPRSDCPDCQRHRSALIVIVVVVFFVAFASGFVTRSLLNQDRDEGQRKFREFLLNADRLGIIDHERLDELIRDGHNARP